MLLCRNPTDEQVVMLREESKGRIVQWLDFKGKRLAWNAASPSPEKLANQLGIKHYESGTYQVN